MLIFILGLGCITDINPPFVGQCAEYPNGVYDYGQIGIGSCLSGPTDLKWLEKDDGSLFLLLDNANPYGIFTGGSLLSIPFSEIDVQQDRHLIHELSPQAMDLPSYAAPIEVVDDDLVMVGVRYSDDARTRVHDDAVYLFDVSNPENIQPSERGPGAADHIIVKSDPIDISYDPSSGYAFVANRTSHDISVIDTQGEELRIVLPWSEALISSVQTIEEDNSGSQVSMDELAVITEELILDPNAPLPELKDDFWRIRWIEGSWQLWLPNGQSWYRTYTQGDFTYRDSALGNELFTDSILFAEIKYPFYHGPGEMWFIDGLNIRRAYWNQDIAAWAHEPEPYFTSDAEQLAGVTSTMGPTDSYFFYAQFSADEWTIQPVFFNELTSELDRSLPPISIAGERVSEPHVVYDSQTVTWTMYFSRYNDDGWQINRATSQDLLTWELDDNSLLPLDEIDRAAPVVSQESDRLRMWYSHRNEDTWNLAYAESFDGLTWIDHGIQKDLNDPSSDPPAVALSAAPTSAFRVEGEDAGVQLNMMEVTAPYLANEHGWYGTAVAGQWLDIDSFGAASAGGVQLDSILPTRGLAWMSLKDRGNWQRIGAAEVDSDGFLTPRSIVLERGTDSWDKDGVFSPVVWERFSTLYMLYAGKNGTATTIGLATSSDGYNWQKIGKVISRGNNWDSAAVVPNHIESTDTGYRLWYSGFDGKKWSIGTAISTDGQNWSRESDEPVFEAGQPGDWDDSGVRDANIYRDEDGLHLWYAGFNGDNWQVGYSLQDDAGEWERTTDITTDIPRSVISEQGLFHSNSSLRPVLWNSDESFDLFYSGLQGTKSRIGRAKGDTPAALRKYYRALNNGDELQFSTQRGDPDIQAIPLDTQTSEFALTGIGLTATYIDAERGFLYAVSKLLPYIVVIDIRDDSDQRTGFIDRNYLDVEAVLAFSNSSGADGFRQVISRDDNTLYAINDSPEAVFIIDISTLEDNEYSEFIQDSYIGWLPAALGVEGDRGATTRMSVGPGQMAEHPTESLFFVSNFNNNSVGVYDLRLGPHGELVHEIMAVGENPYAILPHPNGKFAVIANYTGEVDESNLAQSTLAILDIDPQSPTYLEILSRLVNE